MRAELARSSAALAAARDWSAAGGPALSRAIIAVHVPQVEALTQRLTAVGEATRSPDATPDAPAGTTTRRPSADALDAQGAEAAAKARLLAAETDAVTGANIGWAPIAAADRMLLGACLVTRAQAARLLGSPAQPAPRRPHAANAEQAVELLTVVRPVLYGLEVAAARVVVARGRRVQVARDSLSAIRRQRQFLEQQAGHAAPATPLGYELPGPVDTPQQAQALAQDLLTSLADAHIRALGRLPVGPPTNTGTATPTATPMPTPMPTPTPTPMPTPTPTAGSVAAPEAPPAPNAPGVTDATDATDAADAAVAGLLGWAREAEWWRFAWGAGLRAVPPA